MQRARQASQNLAGTLKGQLMAALQAGGPAHAIQVCHTIAPALAQSISEQEHLHIRRVSLKTRNPNDQPDPFEQQILERW